jgi:hypothetical protein
MFLMKVKPAIKAFKTIHIPHLRFTVYVKDMSELMGVERKGSGYVAQFGDDSACLFLEDVEKTVKQLDRFPTIAHEVLHVIQILCEKFQMKIENEQEHTAYLMHYILEKIIE